MIGAMPTPMPPVPAVDRLKLTGRPLQPQAWTFRHSRCAVIPTACWTIPEREKQMPKSDRGLGRIYGRGDLKWKDRELRLVTGRLLATVGPDTKWAGMYRVRLPDGHVTDMVNISRAKDAAISLALTDLNSFKAQARRVEAPPMRHFSEAAECPPARNANPGDSCESTFSASHDLCPARQPRLRRLSARGWA
jgi:hypothetical protein